MGDSFALVHLLLDELHIKTSELILPISTMDDFPDMGLRAHLFGPAAPFCESLPPTEWLDGDRARVYLIRDHYLCSYFFSPDINHRGQCWLVGPYLTEEPTMRDITGLCKRLDLPMANSGFLRTYYKMLPKLRDQNLIEALFRSHFALHYGRTGFELIPWAMERSGQPAPAKYSPESSHNFQEFLDRTYFTEQKMLDCIAQGNYTGAVSIFSKLQANGVEARTDSSLRDGKNSVIVFNTLCRTAAYRGGARPFDLD